MAITKLDISMLEDVSGANNLVKLDANAKIPATSGANLLNKPGPTKSASDPAIDSNKSLGAEWLNTTDGEMYICTDATTGANVWTNVGAGSGDVRSFHGWGSSYGYTSGGHTSPLYPNNPTDTIQKYSFSSDANATDVGNLSTARNNAGGCMSATYGYTAGGWRHPGSPSQTIYNIIDRFSFTSDGNASDWADLTVVGGAPAPASSQTYGYCMGRMNPTNVYVDVIDKFPFATQTNATDVGNLLTTRGFGYGCMSATHGYNSGGYSNSSPNETNTIQKVSFASDGNATDVGDLTTNLRLGSSCNSATYGYTMGGLNTTASPSAITDNIQKFSFASDGNATNITGNLIAIRRNNTGSSSQTHGYSTGGGQASSGNSPATGYTNLIEKFSFTTEGNATDVGDLLTSWQYYSAGHHY
tara:strand:+ start:51 stop:1292 length:1242 start_codon:yes stop_codon:yes gene_type:complete